MIEHKTDPDRGFEWSRAAVIAGWTALIGVLVAEVIHRLAYGYVPRDLSAYLAAADTFMAGGDPYTDDLFDSARYQGYVYVYPPGTLPLISVLDVASQRVVATLDLLARSAVLIGTLHWLRRRFEIWAPLCALVFVALLFEPVLVDFRAGNLPTYLLGAFLLLVHVAERPRATWHLVAAVGAGLVLAFKPMWLAPACLLLVLRREWASLVGLLAGASVVGGLSAAHAEMVPTWLERLELLAARYRNAVLINLHVAAWVGALAAWLAAAFALVKRRGWDGDALWLWLCVSVVVWPRAGTYSYVMYVPVFFFWWRQWGLKPAALGFVVILGPLPWMLRAFGYFDGYAWLQLAWGIVVGGVLFMQLWVPDSD